MKQKQKSVLFTSSLTASQAAPMSTDFSVDICETKIFELHSLGGGGCRKLNFWVKCETS